MNQMPKKKIGNTRMVTEELGEIIERPESGSQDHRQAEYMVTSTAEPKASGKMFVFCPLLSPKY